jgi:hypothetical protein
MRDFNSIKKIYEESSNVPGDTLALYNRLWQLETWLREMVYVELRTFEKDWENYLPKEKSEHPRSKDKRLTHMATAQESLLAYLTFSDLWNIILDDKLWDCFSVYFPPKDILKSKVEEMSQIRHRVAHFRMPHQDDLRRTELFLRDIDQAFWKFCTSYNKTFPVSRSENNPLVSRFSRGDQFPFLELSINGTGGTRSPNPVLNLTIQRSIRPWVNLGTLNRPSVSGAGIIYHVLIFALDQRTMKYKEILKFTKGFHKNCIHIILGSLCESLTLTFPSILPIETIGDTIEEFLRITHSALWRFVSDEVEAVKVAAEWPEYVLPPTNPFAFLCPDMPCSFFGV